MRCARAVVGFFARRSPRVCGGRICSSCSKKTLLGPAHQPAIEVGFAAKGLVEELTLEVLDILELPSRVAGEKFRKLIEAKQASQDIAEGASTRIERLVHVREFGSTQPYQRASETSLMRRFDRAEDEHREADDYYEYEIRTHQINIGLTNVGDVDLRDGVLTLDFPRIDGLGISEYLRVAPGSELEPLEGYPKVDTGERQIRVQAKVSVAPRHSTVTAFSQPLRLWLRDAAAGHTLPVDYKLHAANLKEPVVGTLRIRVRPD